MRPQDVRLPAELAARLARRAEALLPLGALVAERREPAPAEREALAALAARLANTYPYPAPEYAGQMLKPPHPVAWAAYATAMLLNPNNHALDGGPATAEMERECVAALARAFGLPAHLGHLTSSGTVANLEALWVARELAPGRVILSGVNAHYTHARMCGVLGVPHETVPQDARGRMDLGALARRLAAGGVGAVVATLGTTALGALDDVGAIADLCRAHGARLHVDAAYGGLFAAIADGGAPGVEPAPFAALARADSIVVDPHKHGLQPYGCGCVLFADPGVGRLYAHDSPYTYFTSRDLHLGEISLECSRAGAAAAALWATLRALPLAREGLGAHLAAARGAALDLAARLAAEPGVALVVEPELDIVCAFARRPRASAVSAASARAFDALADRGWHVARLRADAAWLAARHPEVAPDAPHAEALRLCLMKPEHARVTAALAAAVAGALRAG
uniref:Aspartate aminotransferase family protein n=1 Tax=Eiseniibacteriota bacterium TaxID=2212470 RepID=A0A832I6A0_UNCEI